MTLKSAAVFLLPLLIGALSIHLLWPERKGAALALKTALGAGAGLGISSLIYFAFLVVVPGRLNLVLVLTPCLLLLGAAVVARERRNWPDAPRRPEVTRLQSALVAALLLAVAFLALCLYTLVAARPQGGIDTWSIWNRSARFIYRDPVNWRATLSPELHWQTHADYPLLVPLNTAWAWEAVGEETLRVPMMQAVLFAAASLGLMFAAVALTRTLGQACLATLVLAATPVFIYLSSGMVADVPVMYFMFASSLLMFFSLVRAQPLLMGLSAFMGGLAAWTKNEGLLFVTASAAGLILVHRRDLRRLLPAYAIGLAIPLAAVLYLKTIAPANDLFEAGLAGWAAKITDPLRYQVVLQAFGVQALSFGGWPFSILAGLAIYAMAVGFDLPARLRHPAAVIAAALFFQLAGYFAIYIVSPHDLEWHLPTSLYRLILQLYPAGIFLLFSAVSEPEKVLMPV